MSGPCTITSMLKSTELNSLASQHWQHYGTKALSQQINLRACAMWQKKKLGQPTYKLLYCIFQVSCPWSRDGDSYQKVGGRNLAFTPGISLLATCMQNSKALEWTNNGKSGGALPPQF